MKPDIIYKIVPIKLWQAAEAENKFLGAPVDIADGFIHFSTAAQVKATAAKHFAGLDDLLLVSVDSTQLGDSLKYEVSRGGDLFPHLYSSLSLDAVINVQPLPLDNFGQHLFPEMN